MTVSRFLRLASPILIASFIAGCADNPSNSCPDKPYLPKFSVATFNADTILLEIPPAVDCPSETIDTGHIAMRLEGHVESEGGSIDSVWFEFITPSWIMAGSRASALRWTTPADGIVHLRGVKVNITAVTLESEQFVTLEARQDTATY